jgi:hypothetical protein
MSLIEALLNAAARIHDMIKTTLTPAKRPYVINTSSAVIFAGLLKSSVIKNLKFLQEIELVRQLWQDIKNYKAY